MSLPVNDLKKLRDNYFEEESRMKEGFYEIVGMKRSNHGKWIFTARPVNSEISLTMILRK